MAILIGTADHDSLAGGSGDDTLRGGDGHDFLAGGAGNNLLFGDDGFDRFAGGVGNDQMDGGAGIDTVDYMFGPAINLSLALGRQADATGVDTLTGIENVVGTSFADTILGDDQDNRLDGSSGDDQLDGGMGNDRLIAGYGNDVMIGGAGNDRFEVSQVMRTHFIPGSITYVPELLEFPPETEILTGGDGLDTAAYFLGPGDYQIAKTATGWTVSNTLEGVDQLIGVERLEFLNQGRQARVAFDLGADESAGKAVQFIGMLASSSIANKELVGAVLSIFDQGLTVRQVSQIALDVGIMRNLAGSDSNADLVRVLYRSVLGVEASDAVANELAGLMDGNGGSMSQAEFMTAIAAHPLNLQHIDLVGLQQTGIAYL